jgi:uncharacterized membrane protein
VTKSRLEAFSDGVFAIAITLLIIDVKVPPIGGRESLRHALAQQWPHYAGYAISFLVIGIIWVNHHRTFDRIARINGPLSFLNLALLAAVAFLPFTTGLIAEYVRQGGGDSHVAAAVYSANMLAMALTFNAIWIYSDRAKLHDLGDDVRVRQRRSFIGTPLYSAMIGLSFVSAPLTLALHALVAAFYAVDTAADT